MKAIEFIEDARSGRIDIVASTGRALDEIRKIDEDYSFFVKIDEGYSMREAENAASRKTGRLLGLPVSVKDCICVEGMESRSGSRILEGYIPPIESTAVTRIRDEGGIIIGKTSQDVFGFGSFNTNVGLGFKVPKNPIDKERVTGGSSGGSAGITRKLDMPHVALAESTGGSIAAPAAYCGVYGLTPTYGRVSRWGLMDYANSMDKIGIISKGIEEAALVLEIISGHDDKDSTSSRVPVEKYTERRDRKLRVAIVSESMVEGVDEDVKGNMLRLAGDHEMVSLPLTFRYGIQAYYLISMSEASTNLAKYCGMRYGYEEKLTGNFNEYFSSVRSHAFSKEEKRRVILGTFARMTGFRDAFYMKALKVRTRIIQEYKDIFSRYDIILTPTMPGIAPRFSDVAEMTPLENYLTDIMTVGPNVAGFPHLSIPTGESRGMPTAMLAVSDHFNESKLIDFARMIR